MADNQESSNMGTANKPVGVNSKNILEIIEKCRSVLDEQKVPTEGRKLAIWNEKLKRVEWVDIPGQPKATENAYGK